MKALIAMLVIGLAPLASQAQKPVPAKPQAKPAAAKPAPGRNPKLAPAAQKAVEEATPLEEPDPSIKLSEADLDVARKIYVGDIPCELGATVKITPLRREGFFLVSTGRNRFRMHPVESRTGAIRLEDPVRGALWLQLGNKSMLMSQKLGQRLADECQSPDQVTFAEAMKGRPPVNIFEPLRPAPGVPPAPQPHLHGGVIQPAQAASEPAAATGTVPASPAAPASAPVAPAQ